MKETGIVGAKQRQIARGSPDAFEEEIDRMNWPRIANVAILLVGVLLMASVLQDYAAPYLPQWAHYGLLLAFFLPLLWVGHQAELWIARRLEKPTMPDDAK